MCVRFKIYNLSYFFREKESFTTTRQDWPIYRVIIISEVDGVMRGWAELQKTFSDFVIPSDKNSKKSYVDVANRDNITFAQNFVKNGKLL
jgi:hypothetical protein